MSYKWQDFERIIAAIHANAHGAAAVTWNEEINGRQFDVVVRFRNGIHEYLTVIECKDYSSKVSVDKVDAFATKSRDANANKSVMVAANGFQSGCIEVARRHGITLLSLHESVDESKLTTEGPFTKVLNIYRVRLVESSSAAEIEFDERNGRMEYLMGHCQLVNPHWSTNPSAVIEQWRQEVMPTTSGDESRFVINFPVGTIAKIPFEDAISVSAMRFHCREVIASANGENQLTRHLRELQVLQHELQDCITGGTVFKISQNDLDLGFDSIIEAKQFYASMNGTMNYYCTEINAGLATMLLLESYQHGRFIQMKFTQKLTNAKNYVLINDKVSLKRLQKMLAQWG